MTVYKDYYDRAMERAKSRKGKYYKTLRQCTVEPVFGTLINFTGMRKINTRGIESANKVMLMAAIAYNLKKLLKYRGNIGNHTALMGFKNLLNNISSSLLYKFYLRIRLLLRIELNLQTILI